jgi:hypothetical protein
MEQVVIVLKSVRQIFLTISEHLLVEGYNMFLDGFGIAGYRSFGAELQKMGPFKKVNLFIGQNNSGKSNIILFLTHHLKNAQLSLTRNQPEFKFDSLFDFHFGNSSKNMQFAFCVNSTKLYDQLLISCGENLTGNTESVRCLKKLLASDLISGGTDASWFVYESLFRGTPELSKQFIEQLKTSKSLEDREWSILWNGLTGQGKGNLDQHWIPQSLVRITTIISGFQIPAINLIPAIRRIGDSGSQEADDYSGLGIINRLAKLQNPPPHQQKLKERFNTINEFVRQVTGNSSATLEIPYERDMILVHMDGKSLPLSSLGTGIHEVIILGAAATVLNDQILCIEEPELHLHPLLQKKLLKYIQKETTNQYFITTHSAHLLDTPDVAIFHVRQQDNQSIVSLVSTDIEKVGICADLGYKASDLLQANCIIWVEGPSDRIYLKHWIKAIDSELLEGVHYSIMYYGGRLLSHLTANDVQINEFISLRRLNRYISILIDSDRSSAHKHLNDTKKRIRIEFDNGPGFAWITNGREVENYILPDDLEKAVINVHQSATGLELKGQFDNCLKRYKTKTGFSADDSVDKVRVAHEIVKLPSNLDPFDLREQVTKLVKFIHDANGLGVSNN